MLNFSVKICVCLLLIAKTSDFVSGAPKNESDDDEEFLDIFSDYDEEDDYGDGDGDKDKNDFDLANKQIPLFSESPLSGLSNLVRAPCTCQTGVCGCCTGNMIPAINSRGCMNLTYVPEDFSFEFRMMFNDRTLYRNQVIGRNPRPVCVNPPRLRIIKLCAKFYDVYFVGRNMHACMEMQGKFQQTELFAV